MENTETLNAKRGADSQQRMVRLPFRVKVHDEKCREVETPPLWLEFPEPPNAGGWDWLSAVESEAKAILIADLECRVDWDAHRQPNQQGEHMRNQEIDIAIAEACGWREVQDPIMFSALMRTPAGIAPDHQDRLFSSIPSYCTDLNAIHEAEKALKGEREWEAYIQNLLKLTRGKGFVVLHATARQKAEALLRTKGLWQEIT